MEHTTVTIGGKEYGACYCFGTEIIFHKLSGLNIEQLDATNPEHSVCLILASILAYYQTKNEDMPLTDREILENASPREIVDTLKAVATMRARFYELPEDEVEKIKALGEEQGKN